MIFVLLSHLFAGVVIFNHRVVRLLLLLLRDGLWSNFGGLKRVIRQILVKERPGPIFVYHELLALQTWLLGNL